MSADLSERVMVRVGDEFAINLANVQFNRHFASEPHLFNPMAVFCVAAAEAVAVAALAARAHTGDDRGPGEGRAHSDLANSVQ